MGVEQTVTFPSGVPPSWEAVLELLVGWGYAVQMRMVDGQLALPDEQPPPSWRELRVALPQGMLTLRREGSALVCVTWGNADAGLQEAWNALARACAEAGAGQVHRQVGISDSGGP
jgi:hypothetical protein